MSGPLAGVRVVTIAVNVPGPVAAARLAALGAHVTKVEPPGGDPLAAFAGPGYDELRAGQEVVTLDLKTDDGRAALHGLLSSADLLLTSHRPAALARLGLSWSQLHAAHPRLVQIAIVGHPGEGADVPGHDLTYQAVNGLLGAEMPRVLLADLGGGDRAAIEALAALLERGADGPGTYREVALSQAAHDMARPRRWGLTQPGGLLAGGFPAYGVYACADGRVAVAALEPHFHRRLLEVLGVEDTRAALAAAFAGRTRAEWESWAAAHDLPLAALPD
ncbi:CoA transferase [Lapillicoccus jejuensis]|uniref:Crotonobetainyl-CoA:carnitine CoA-transferase CaiB-like acyl-CoA transferase n=1 Tax=Lapillicoccus jejuensis TaxID=402171 RepID=A0A542E550_9MICO|nr:CoA transferase [Lapillicoccus jejuensis]TQJ10406.1 crotonobetainyl-CoA:carnitine CoA-transferase CaiB-like acyl-CoA transferase [Lapillicoccus jejuensis]